MELSNLKNRHDNLLRTCWIWSWILCRFWICQLADQIQFLICKMGTAVMPSEIKEGQKWRSYNSGISQSYYYDNFFYYQEQHEAFPEYIIGFQTLPNNTYLPHLFCRLINVSECLNTMPLQKQWHYNLLGHSSIVISTN